MNAILATLPGKVLIQHLPPWRKGTPGGGHLNPSPTSTYTYSPYEGCCDYSRCGTRDQNDIRPFGQGKKSPFQAVHRTGRNANSCPHAAPICRLAGCF